MLVIILYNIFLNILCYNNSMTTKHKGNDYKLNALEFIRKPSNRTRKLKNYL